MSEPVTTESRSSLSPGAQPNGPAPNPGNGGSDSSGGTHGSVERKAGEESTSQVNFAREIEDAIRLLEYAAESGIKLDDDVRGNILAAKMAANGRLDEQTANKFLVARTKLAAEVGPVTARSLEKSEGKTGRFYFYWAVIFGLPAVLFSVAAFVSSGLSDNIRQDITTANTLAVRLTENLQPPTNHEVLERGLVRPLPPGVTVNDVLQDLQVFAGAIRAIDRRTQQLNRFLFENLSTDELRTNRENRELNLQMLNTNLPAEAEFRIRIYQNVRYRAQNTQEWVSLWYGAAAKYILPLLYALLGACACLARRLESETRTRTFDGDDKHHIHFVIAGIGGLVVGLFTNFSATQGASLPPLAIAFLAGYSVDSFFRFLESLLDVLFNKRAEPSPTQPHSAAPKK